MQELSQNTEEGSLFSKLSTAINLKINLKEVLI